MSQLCTYMRTYIRTYMYIHVRWGMASLMKFLSLHVCTCTHICIYTHTVLFVVIIYMFVVCGKVHQFRSTTYVCILAHQLHINVHTYVDIITYTYVHVCLRKKYIQNMFEFMVIEICCETLHQFTELCVVDLEKFYRQKIFSCGTL